MSDLVHGVEVIDIDEGTRPISTVRTSVIGLVGTAPNANAADLPLNTPVLLAGSPRTALNLVRGGNAEADGGTLGEALTAIYAVTNPVIVIVRIEDPGAGVLATALAGNALERTGVYALLNAESNTGIKPRILIAPCPDGFNYGVGGAIDGAPCAAALAVVAERLKAVCVIDGPDMDSADANEAVQVIGSKRAFLVDPWVEYNDTYQANSPFVAALISKTDNEEGFWVSPSNHVIPGITGLSRPIDFALGDPACEADILNGFHVATIIRQGGYRLWGNRTCETEDPKWRYLSVVRTADMINESILASHLWAVDRGVTATYLESVVDGVKAYLRAKKAEGAILGGNCWADPELNTPESVQNGQVYFDFDFTPPYPAEKVTFRSHLVNDYIAEII